MQGNRSILVIVGAGDVGGRLARLRAARGEDVLALRRRLREDAPFNQVDRDTLYGGGVEGYMTTRRWTRSTHWRKRGRRGSVASSRSSKERKGMREHAGAPVGIGESTREHTSSI